MMQSRFFRLNGAIFIGILCLSPLFFQNCAGPGFSSTDFSQSQNSELASQCKLSAKASSYSSSGPLVIDRQSKTVVLVGYNHWWFDGSYNFDNFKEDPNQREEFNEIS